MRHPVLFVLLIVLAVGVAGAGVFLGIGGVGPRSKYGAPQSQLPNYGAITPPPAPPYAFYQPPQAQVRGMVLVDQAHFNDFQASEIQSLVTLILSQGFSLSYLEGKREQEDGLRQADAFIVISPRQPYSPEEMAGVRRFVEQGGKLFLLSDPARLGEINSLAREFGATFEEDYLFNLKENAGNYRYIIIKDFGEHPITQGVKSLALYTAGSLSSQGQGLAFGDENTRSSLLQDREKSSPIALSAGSRVLLVNDLTFLWEPYMTTLDNSRFIANIAGWLTKSERVFSLTDFPHFLKDTISVTYTDPSLWDMAQELRDFFLARHKKPELRGYEKASPLRQDLFILGLFRHSQRVKEYLEKGNIVISVPGEIRGRVVDEKTGDPIEGGMVAAVSAEDSFETPIKGDGSFFLSPLPPATYELTASGKGYKEKKATLRIGEGEKLEQRFLLTPWGKGFIKGCAKEADSGKPIKGAEVALEGTDFTATTNKEGCYQIKDVFEGLYQVRTTAEGFKPLAQELKVVPEATLTADFTLSPGEAEKAEVVSKGGLQGQVKDVDSQGPIDRAEVVVRGTKLSAFTDSRGFYSLRGVPKGTYQVTIRVDGYRPLTKKVRVVAEETVTVNFELITPLVMEIKGLGKFHQKGTALLYFQPGPGPTVLICLADTEQTLRKALDLLQDGGFRKWLVGDNLVVYQAGVGPLPAASKSI